MSDMVGNPEDRFSRVVAQIVPANFIYIDEAFVQTILNTK